MIESRTICDRCGEEIGVDTQRAEMTVSEYEILHNPHQGYSVPVHLTLQLHWACYEQELMPVVRATDK